MPQKTIIVPAAAESIEVNLTGCSVVILQAPLYESIGEEPQLSFNSAGDNKPVLPGAVFNNGQNGFSRIVITGTAASDGDTIKIYVSNDYITEKIPLQLSSATQARLGTSFYIVSSDTPNALTEMQLIDPDGNLPTAVYLSARAADIIYAAIADPAQTDDGHTLAAGDRPIKIEGLNNILNINFISAAAATPGTLTITPEY